MKITIESTTKVVVVDNVTCRVWEGETERGVKIHCFIPRFVLRCSIMAAERIFAKDDQDLSQFEAELQEQRPPSPEIAAIPLRLIL
jgi:hypothetical protein